MTNQKFANQSWSNRRCLLASNETWCFHCEAELRTIFDLTKYFCAKQTFRKRSCLLANLRFAKKQSLVALWRSGAVGEAELVKSTMLATCKVAVKAKQRSSCKEAKLVHKPCEAPLRQQFVQSKEPVGQIGDVGDPSGRNGCAIQDERTVWVHEQSSAHKLCEAELRQQFVRSKGSKAGQIGFTKRSFCEAKRTAL